MGIQREVRIDLLRGITLLLIFIGHAEFTFSATFQHSRGFADASELFVLLAGMSSALAYYRPNADLSLLRPWRRAWRIYLAHLLLFLIMAAFASMVAIEYADTSVVEYVSGFLADPLWRGIQALLLVYMPGDLDILPMYIVLMLWVPFVFVLYDRFPLLLVGISAALWVIAGLGHVNLSNLAQEGGHWYFDPLSWQLIFTIGVVLGIRIRTGRDPLPYNRMAFALAAVFAILAIPMNLAYFLEWAQLPYQGFYRELVSKTNSGPLRIVDALAILYLAWNLDIVKKAARLSWLRPVSMIGRHSLPIFSIGIVLSASASVYMDVNPHAPLGVQMAILFAGCAIHLALGWFLERHRLRSSSTRLQFDGANPA
ncbi:OpgC family protein [Aliirhizobium smilacinae]|uniref:OpgC domain-containing protein n=1 Tax=Aliirhizobium smilacinae TaxID=1395944 RepID=A0A5C4XRI1_9HYPH|nr:OpgC domain-containing protein [Rhizobium smilacinae]TNM65909.1 OpgC domain-containing protein [Rhizobium smilacinae]